LTIAIVGIVFYSAGTYCNSSPTPTSVVTPLLTVSSTITTTPAPIGDETPNSVYTITYSELSRNETMIEVKCKFEPNNYIFQLNASSVYLTQGDIKISANLNEPVIIGTQHWTLCFPINGYNGTGYRLSSDELPLDTSWIKQ
jgi:hypothetical protein